MHTERLPLAGATPGMSCELTLLHFGQVNARPKAYIQAGLHADEAPGMLCAHELKSKLQALEADGLVRGHIVLVPAANPIGMAQFVLGTQHGRFALADGRNFNRGFPALAEAAGALLAGRLGSERALNDAAVRDALRSALADCAAERLAEDLKIRLLRNAVDADTVLDLHCDGEAAVHLYTLTSQAEIFAPLAAWIGARAVLLSDRSGGDPFDEAVSRPWLDIRRRFAGVPLAECPAAATVELRGEADVDPELAAADARAIVNFLAVRGHLSIAPDRLPPPACSPTPLEGSEALEAPAAGLVVFRRAVGDTVADGDLIAEIVDPVSGAAHPVRATTSGVLYARTSVRFAAVGRRLGKIAGTRPFRSGELLSP